MISDVENHKDSTTTTKKTVRLDELSKTAGHRINTQKSVRFLYSSNEQTERQIKKIIPFTITSNV